eukprot:COSAG05_NODE_8164_length_730_cov_0.675119_1_plen_207_part_01
MQREQTTAQVATIEGCLRRERALRAELSVVKESLYGGGRDGGSSPTVPASIQSTTRRRRGARGQQLEYSSRQQQGEGGPGQEERVLSEELVHVTRELQHLQGLYAHSVATGRQHQEQLVQLRGLAHQQQQREEERRSTAAAAAAATAEATAWNAHQRQLQEEEAAEAEELHQLMSVGSEFSTGSRSEIDQEDATGGGGGEWEENGMS